MEEVVSSALDKNPAHNEHYGRIEPTPLVEFLRLADEHKDAGTRLAAQTRFGGFKRLFLRLARLHTAEQAAFNHATLAALHSLSQSITGVQTDADQRLARTQATATSLEMLQAGMRSQIEALEQRVAALSTSLAELTGRHVGAQTELAMLRARLTMFLEEARRRLPEPFDAPQLDTFAREAEDWLAPLYAQLEDTFRGSREQIMELQREYLDDMKALAAEGPVVDIGCGRGEWLELLREAGIDAYGVDTNQQFAENNVARGLDVRHEDAIEHLGKLEPGSVAAVTAFHVVEHLPFPDVVRLVDAALSAVRGGGVLILETPNPTNLVVGASAFYIDPTHRNPVHPQFLQFLVEARGFVDVEVRFLHPSHEQNFTLPGADSPEVRRVLDHVNWSLFGPQDYAVIARKPRPT